MDSFLNLIFGGIPLSQLATIPARLLEAIGNPAANLYLAALALLLILNLVAIFGIMIALIFLPRNTEDAEYDDEFEVDDVDDDKAEQPRTSVPKAPLWRRFLAGFVTALSAFSLVIFIAFLAGGVSTRVDAVCRGCHGGQIHIKSLKTGPHRDTSCVQCHESQSGLISGFVEYPARVIHIIEGFAASTSVNYGRVNSGACIRCHENVLGKTIVNNTTGIRMSHAEPLKERIQCGECHTYSKTTGQLDVIDGMQRCIRCHSEEAVGNCSVCHTRDIGAPAATRLGDISGSRVSAPYNCYGCHSPKPCDSCHGLRLPHSAEFVQGGHMYEGAKSAWSGTSGLCYRCHNPKKRSCAGKCHEKMPYHTLTRPAFASEHQVGVFYKEDGRGGFGCPLCHDKFEKGICVECHPTITGPAPHP